MVQNQGQARPKTTRKTQWLEGFLQSNMHGHTHVMSCSSCTEGVCLVFEMFIFVFEMLTLLCLNTKGVKRVESFGSQKPSISHST